MGTYSLYTNILKDLIMEYNASYELNNDTSKIMQRVAYQHIKEGANLLDIDFEFFKECCAMGYYPSILGYGGFPKSCCLSPNNTIAHGLPFDYTLVDGDIVTLDICTFNGFVHSDMAETYTIGRVSGEHKKLVDTTRDCLYNSIGICKPGVSYNQIGKVVEKIAKENGFYVVDNVSGHGIGEEIHMSPTIENHAHSKVKQVMEVGDTFTIEPLLAIGSGKYYIDKDGYSIKTKNKK